MSGEQVGTAERAYFEMFGTLRVTVAGQPRPIKSRKSRALLAYLALSPQKSESRVRIAGLLWSEKTDKELRVSLRQQLMGLKRDLGAAGAGRTGLGQAQCLARRRRHRLRHRPRVRRRWVQGRSPNCCSSGSR